MVNMRLFLKGKEEQYLRNDYHVGPMIVKKRIDANQKIKVVFFVVTAGVLTVDSPRDSHDLQR